MDRLSFALLPVAAIALAGFVVLTAPSTQREPSLPVAVAEPVVEPVVEPATTVVIETVAPELCREFTRTRITSCRHFRQRLQRDQSQFRRTRRWRGFAFADLIKRLR